MSFTDIVDNYSLKKQTQFLIKKDLSETKVVLVNTQRIIDVLEVDNTAYDMPYVKYVQYFITDNRYKLN